MDIGTIMGLLVAAGAILLGLMLEGGQIAQILQPTAALIVFGGTFGAIMVQFPVRVVLAAFRSLATIFFVPKSDPLGTIQEIVAIAHKARREGIVSLDRDLDKIQSPFMKKALMLAVDGTEPGELRKMMELELEKQGEHEDNIPKVFESAGGFSPTIGIIGAILGLIQVMQHLDNINEVGKGIAVAFVATVYGVGAANLLLLPAAGKLRIRTREEQIIREMTLEGVISILEGMNPRMIENKLISFLAEMPAQEKEREQVQA
ncbi:MAG TPA: flagellar motor protein [Candidatus Acidoferrum sp.]|jgi:chemotaxis protein MotA|nr:flagellar motor protein [Candidatus Acidoferrum sp.]